MRIKIIKFGGSIISPHASKGKFEEELVESIAADLLPFHKYTILVHGTGFVGKQPAIQYGYYQKGRAPKKDALRMLKIREDLRLLNHHFIRALLSAGIPAIPCSAPHFFHETMDGLKEEALPGLVKTLDLGFVPVFHGDVMTCSDGSFKIFSSDVITLILSRVFRPDNVLFLTDVKGVYKKMDGDFEIPLASDMITTLDAKTVAGLTPSDRDKKDVSGGMAKKIACALEVAGYSGRCFIGCGFTPKFVSRFLNHQPVEGTRVVADR